MLTSSPPRGPCSISQSSPEAGWIASALRVAMAVAPDLRLGVGAAGERVACGHRTIGRDPDHLAEMIVETLRLIAEGEMLAQRDEQIAVVGLRDAAAVMVAR